ncbi:unnamed protein product [Linum trigynum]|uniref:Uncharacterized protein n=1 Tax=Linum trigynum TaxID=586398 RepID=A0AAV2CMM3_9ROSI
MTRLEFNPVYWHRVDQVADHSNSIQTSEVETFGISISLDIGVLGIYLKPASKQKLQRARQVESNGVTGVTRWIQSAVEMTPM